MNRDPAPFPFNVVIPWRRPAQTVKKDENTKVFNIVQWEGA